MAEDFDKPVYTVSAKAIKLVARISAALEHYKILMNGPEGVRLRKINHIKTIRGTTAIEGNTLTEEEITTILAGKRVLAPERELREVFNAHEAYNLIQDVNPERADELLRLHAVMAKGLVQRPGAWRDCNVVVAGAHGVILHQAPPWDHVPFLMSDLFAWLRESDDHVLISSCVFHWRFETIHPFVDGNGRMGRYWQTALLGKWNPLFYSAPIENMVFSYQQEYYKALRTSQQANDASVFIDFMLDIILRTIKARGVKDVSTSTSESIQKGIQKSIQKIEQEISKNPFVTIKELSAKLGLSEIAVKKNLRKLKDLGRICRVGPDRGGHWERA